MGCLHWETAREQFVHNLIFNTIPKSRCVWGMSNYWLGVSWPPKPVRLERRIGCKAEVVRWGARCIGLIVVAASIGISAAPVFAADDGSPAFKMPDWVAPWNVTDNFQFFSPTLLQNWKFGVYGGRLVNAPFYKLNEFPFAGTRNMHIVNEDLIALNAVYRIARLPHLPVDIELDLVAAQHFSHQSFGEFAAIPTVRWSWFPWNRYVYTTTRTGVLGPSWTTSKSTDEAMESVGHKTSNYLNFLVREWTFAPAEDSTWEAFLRIHHRSGIWGLINGVNGGTNYVTLGVRGQL
jgi:hypothetical protein